ncbi:histidine phosphatase family protein [bacterium]|nr:histidine phosphatase family protein [bacterium]
MTRELLLLRHGKSSWASPGLSDHDRPLNSRGVEATTQMGRLILSQRLLPALVRCSTAVRTCETWRVMAETWAEIGVPLPTYQTDSQLYLATVAQLATTIQATDDAVPRLMLIGHNPGLEELFAQLSGRHEEIPTACLMALRLPINHWLEFTPSTRSEVLGLWRPRELDVN